MGTGGGPGDPAFCAQYGQWFFSSVRFLFSLFCQVLLLYIHRCRCPSSLFVVCLRCVTLRVGATRKKVRSRTDVYVLSLSPFSGAGWLSLVRITLLGLSLYSYWLLRTPIRSNHAPTRISTLFAASYTYMHSQLVSR